MSCPFTLTRTPSVTIKTNSYHFCKLSLVNKPSHCLTRDGDVSSATATDKQRDSATEFRERKDKYNLKASETIDTELVAGITGEMAKEGPLDAHTQIEGMEIVQITFEEQFVYMLINSCQCFLLLLDGTSDLLQIDLLTCFYDYVGPEELKYVAVAGEQSSEVCKFSWFY